MITWITEKVAIGERGDFLLPIEGASKKLFKKEGIDCVLDLTINNAPSELFFCNRIGIDYFNIAVGRHEEAGLTKIELRTAAYMLKQLTKKYSRILVHCTAGMDRAPFVVAWWMVEKKNLSLDRGWGDYYKREWIEDFYKLIKKKRPQMREHMEWV